MSLIGRWRLRAPGKMYSLPRVTGRVFKDAQRLSGKRDNMLGVGLADGVAPLGLIPVDICPTGVAQFAWAHKHHWGQPGSTANRGSVGVAIQSAKGTPKQTAGL